MTMLVKTNITEMATSVQEIIGPCQRELQSRALSSRG